MDGSDLDTQAEIGAYDVVVVGAGNFSCAWDWSSYDAQLPAYVQSGGGVVATGWVLYYLADNTKNETYPGFEAVLPMSKSLNYSSGQTVSVVSGHPITTGLGASFTNPDYDAYGAGMKPGATSLMKEGATDVGAAWSLGNGRSVYLGPDYLANFGGYANEALLDGTIPTAQLLLLQAIEWAGAGSAALDTDSDGVLDASDNCPMVANPTQADLDTDGAGDACDADDDNDGVEDSTDNCAGLVNAGQEDNDSDGAGDVCDVDDDNDGVLDGTDNCPQSSNPGQENHDTDAAGDACDADDDDDGVPDVADNCVFDVNGGQENADSDAAGNVCDSDDDGDSVLDPADNCPLLENLSQLDSDSDGVGDACDSTPLPIMDAGMSVDAGNTGEGAPDAGGGGTPPVTGCGCAAGTGSASSALLFFAALAMARLMRRSDRERARPS